MRGTILVPSLVLARRVRLPGVRVTGREIGRRGPTIVGASVHVRIGGGSILPRAVAVGILVVAARKRVLVHRGRSAAGRRTVASSTPPVIVIVPTRRRSALAVPITVAIPGRAVPTRRAPTAVVIGGSLVGTARRTRTSSVTGDVRLGLQRGSVEHRRVDLGRAYVGNAGHANVLELAAVQFLDGVPEVGGGLILDKPRTRSQSCGFPRACELNLPFVTAIAVRLGVDNVKAGLASEVFQILKPESM